MNNATNHWESLFKTLHRAALRAESTGSQQGFLLKPLSESLPSGIETVFKDFHSETIEENHPFLDAFLLEAAEFWNTSSEAATETPGPQSGSWVEVGPDGNDYYFEAQAFQIAGQSYLIIDDLGDRYTENQSLLQKGRDNLLLNERLQREIQLREVLYHCMVHDMRGPMNNVKMALEIISTADKQKDLEQRMIEIAMNAITQQSQLIDDVLLVFKEEGNAASEKILPQVDLIAVALSAIDSLQGQAAAASVSCQLTNNPSAGPINVRGDESALARVFYNFISNAIRHSPAEGQIMVEIENTPNGTEARVSDTGPGITPGDEQKVFEKFIQTAGEKSGKVGLGLYYCRLALQRMGGQVGARNNPETGGACFWFHLPQ
jgi:hypothetical protein